VPALRRDLAVERLLAAQALQEPGNDLPNGREVLVEVRRVCVLGQALFEDTPQIVRNGEQLPGGLIRCHFVRNSACVLTPSRC
jgi:hypothetical protein